MKVNEVLALLKKMAGISLPPAAVIGNSSTQ